LSFGGASLSFPSGVGGGSGGSGGSDDGLSSAWPRTSKGGASTRTCAELQPRATAKAAEPSRNQRGWSIGATPSGHRNLGVLIGPRRGGTLADFAGRAESSQNGDHEQSGERAGDPRPRRRFRSRRHARPPAHRLRRFAPR